ncbi:MAG: hypothetical protein CVV41_09850 [Candidatus Riflebacteria bacterium HGW-Riflebacteria-1]|jgi:hypothetical protein|nr:MAG: hypothetical protein CVV41_09850 [Candidatus Riflebacteria bacterium HGW-Riflebacteria-1]
MKLPITLPKQKNVAYIVCVVVVGDSMSVKKLTAEFVKEEDFLLCEERIRDGYFGTDTEMETMLDIALNEHICRPDEENFINVKVE